MDHARREFRKHASVTVAAVSAAACRAPQQSPSAAQSPAPATATSTDITSKDLTIRAASRPRRARELARDKAALKVVASGDRRQGVVAASAPVAGEETAPPTINGTCLVQTNFRALPSLTAAITIGICTFASQSDAA